MIRDTLCLARTNSHSFHNDVTSTMVCVPMSASHTILCNHTRKAILTNNHGYQECSLSFQELCGPSWCIWFWIPRLSLRQKSPSCYPHSQALPTYKEAGGEANNFRSSWIIRSWQLVNLYVIPRPCPAFWPGNIQFFDWIYMVRNKGKKVGQPKMAHTIHCLGYTMHLSQTTV